jgi:tetratricopeptide (TPR) repeat protein
VSLTPGRRALLFVALAAATWLTFQPLLGAGFVWDDRDNVQSNPHIRGLDRAKLAWMVGGEAMHHSHFQPLTWFSYGVDHALWGMRPAGFHLTNILLHVLVALLLAQLIRRVLALSRGREDSFCTWAAFVGAALYALHPMRVENVGWVTERRDLLAAVFYLLGLLAYLRAHQHARPRQLVWSWLAFLLSGLAKAWVITLPLVLLVCDLWPLRRLDEAHSRRRALLEKLAFVPLAVVFATTGWLAMQRAGAPAAGHGLLDRVLQASYGLFYYPIKSLWPSDLSPLHLLRTQDLHDAAHIAALIAALILAALTLLSLRRRPWLSATVLAYVLIIAPVLGLTQVGQQAVAERYAYLASWPLWIAAAAGLAALARRLAARPRLAWLCLALPLAPMVLLAWQARDYSRAWHSERALWRHATAVDPRNVVAWTNLADVLRSDDRAAARRAVDRALKLAPRHAPAWGLSASLHAEIGRFRAARADFDRAVGLAPRNAVLRCNRGAVLLRLGDREAAAADFEAGLRANTRHAPCYLGRSQLRRLTGRRADALRDAQRAVSLAALSPAAWTNLAQLRVASGDHRGGLVAYDRAVALGPASADLRLRRGLLRAQRGDLRGALADFERALARAAKGWPLRAKAELMARQARRQLAQPRR